VVRAPGGSISSPTDHERAFSRHLINVTLYIIYTGVFPMKLTRYLDSRTSWATEEEIAFDFGVPQAALGYQ